MSGLDRPPERRRRSRPLALQATQGIGIVLLLTATTAVVALVIAYLVSVAF